MCVETGAGADASDAPDARDLSRVLMGAAEFAGDGELVWQLGVPQWRNGGVGLTEYQPIPDGASLANRGPTFAREG